MPFFPLSLPIKPPANQVPNHINMYSQYLTPTNAVAPNQLQDFPAPGQFMTPNGAVIPFVQPRPKNDKLEVSFYRKFDLFGVYCTFGLFGGFFF